MAKGKYARWLTPEGLTLLRGWARDGLTDAQIAENCGISTKTLYEWKNRYGEICEALKESKEIADYQVENALYRAALEGNVTAMIYWLKNRRRDKWRDRPETEAEDSAPCGVIEMVAADPEPEPPTEDGAYE